ncbi:MAG TPA: hypothetical protein VGE65_05405 [Sphingobium sp.]
MTRINRTMTILLAGAALPLLAGCGANEIASPGTGGNVTINLPGTGTPTPTPTPTPTGGVTAATACPAIADSKGLKDDGVITGPTGSYRVCTLPAIIAKSSILPKITGLVYQLNGRVDVGCDGGFSAPTVGAPRTSSTAGCTAANGFTLTGGQLTADTNVTLTIAAGAIVVGNSGPSWLAVNRGNKIDAQGTASNPIIFTSRENVLGTNTDSSIGQWGGIVLLGRAPVTDCTTGSVGSGTCERQTEGAVDPAVFGGADSAYNAGTIKYMQIRYSGYVLSAGIELQSLTTEGIGTGTTLDYIQSHNSSDDGAEFFGGSVNFKHYIATGADDDSLDFDTGGQGNFQYVLLIQRTGQGDALFEIDSNGNEADTPRTKLNVANFTALQPAASANNDAADQASALFRGNSDTTLVNGIIATPNNECVRLNGSGTTPATLVARSVVMQCNATKYIGTGSYTAAQVATAFGAGANNNSDSFVPTLTAVFVNATAETAVVATDPKTVNAFFDTTTYVGAVKDANDNWYKGWTCNSSYAPMDTTTNANRACTSLPIT